jgi:DNA repair exonuclease SbcCD ATPase subunit
MSRENFINKVKPTPSALAAYDSLQKKTKETGIGFDQFTDIQKRWDAEEGKLIDQSYAILNPLDQQARIAAELSESMEQFHAAHKNVSEDEEKAAQQHFLSTAEMHEHNQMLQEGASLLEKYKEPLDRLIDSQTKLKQLRAARAISDKVFQKAMADEYGKAHKDYTAQFKTTRMEALGTGTSAAAEAMQEYNLGKMAIPLDNMQDKKADAADVQADLTKSNIELKTSIDSLVTKISGGKAKAVGDINFADFVGAV